MDGTIVGADGLGVILDDGDLQVLVRLDAILAVSFSRAHIESVGDDDDQARTSGSTDRAPIEAGPVGG